MNAQESETSAVNSKEFAIKDCALIAIATGNRALTLKELRDALTVISLDSVYYHFWGSLLQPRFEEREYNNDFAAWAWYGLHDPPLAERLAVVDPTGFLDLGALRQELLEIIEERLDEREDLSYMRASSRFEFIRSQIVIFDTLKTVQSPADLAGLLPSLSTSSIFYHFIDARRRLENHGNDFSFWMEGFGVEFQDLRGQLSSIDPFFGSLAQIKAQLVELFSKHFSEERL